MKIFKKLENNKFKENAKDKVFTHPLIHRTPKFDSLLCRDKITRENMIKLSMGAKQFIDMKREGQTNRHSGK